MGPWPTESFCLQAPFGHPKEELGKPGGNVAGKTGRALVQDLHAGGGGLVLDLGMGAWLRHNCWA